MQADIEELEDLYATLERFSSLRVLVVGDVMLDAYVWGQVQNMSAEAPVPILLRETETRSLGGAANVAMSLRGLSAQPILCGVVGKDEEGKQLLNQLQENEIPREGIHISPNRPTTLKTRFVSGTHHLLRLDRESIEPLNKEEEKILWKQIEKYIPQVHVILIQDYNKGCLSASLIDKILQAARERTRPVVVDPKRRNFFRYQHVSLFKPNLKELTDAMEESMPVFKMERVEELARNLQERLQASRVLVTLSERGILALEGENLQHFPTQARVISDVSGAGDAVISIAALCTALNLPLSFLTKLGNIAGSIVCGQKGVAHLDKKSLISFFKASLGNPGTG
ncbi:MAG: bifunctional ADP-heptose synthase [Cytophagales bacterium]|nr:bifunctional ADP-heptose synthase [Cytophagales bacterium]